jgi:hypothetical protein
MTPLTFVWSITMFAIVAISCVWKAVAKSSFKNRDYVIQCSLILAAAIFATIIIVGSS